MYFSRTTFSEYLSVAASHYGRLHLQQLLKDVLQSLYGFLWSLWSQTYRLKNKVFLRYLLKVFVNLTSASELILYEQISKKQPSYKMFLKVKMTASIPTTMVIIFWEFLMFYQIFLSPQENFVNTSKKLLENRNWAFPVVRYFTWKLEFFSNISSVVIELPCRQTQI